MFDTFASILFVSCVLYFNFIEAQMVTIIKTMVTIINKMTKSKWRFAQVHEKRYN